MLEKYQCREGFLQKLNPVIKLGGLMAVVLVMMTVMNPWVPLVMIVLAASPCGFWAACR